MIWDLNQNRSSINETELEEVIDFEMKLADVFVYYPKLSMFFEYLKNCFFFLKLQYSDSEEMPSFSNIMTLSELQEKLPKVKFTEKMN